MSMVLDLPPDLESGVRRLAEERGVDPADYVRALLEEALHKERGARAAALLAAWDEEDRTDDPAELEARRVDWEAQKSAMNEAHSSDRKLFP
ncbi:hypothetical protein [Polyangium aurulentum]|uniref:hypothetical protein n=1 Tax=Polyangium aurulentum TaxID=2567896 RepID=UPI0010AECE65|nr:hypothetical protein [Polyangium aurulentum]UQA63310.1 hypothetical protein E8A73_023720 [Polyangium aurulentum]